MTNSFEIDLKNITLSLEGNTEERLKQLNLIYNKMKEIEEVHKKHYYMILKLKDVHKMHISIENLQKTLTMDQGNLSKDLEYLLTQANADVVISSALKRIDPLYEDMVLKGIPKLKQIQDHFAKASLRARRAALIKKKNFFNAFTSLIAIQFIQKNVKIVDDNDTFSILRAAEEALEKGDLRKSLQEINRLSGFPSEEMVEITKDIKLRLAIIDLIEILTGYTVSEVQKLLNNQTLN